MRSVTQVIISVVLIGASIGCRTGESVTIVASDASPPPSWLRSLQFPEGQVCTIGIAGPGTTHDGPKTLAQSRGVDTLAMSIETLVWEGIIDQARNGNTSVQAQSIVGTSAALIERLREEAEVVWWFDTHGQGFVGLPNYTYARVCTDVDRKTLSMFERSESSGLYSDLRNGPAWLSLNHTTKKGRLCALGQSRKTHDPSDAIEQAGEDVRVQLSESMQALVSSLSIATEGVGAFQSESVTVGLNLGGVEGAVVNHHWFDRDGRGPLNEAGAAYAWGCVYPEIEFERRRQAAISDGDDIQADAFARARESARAMFSELEAEER